MPCKKFLFGGVGGQSEKKFRKLFSSNGLLGLGEVLNRKLASKGAFPVEKKICAFKLATDPTAALNGNCSMRVSLNRCACQC